MDRYKKSALHRSKADHLNKSWGVGAAQALYRETGNWYHRLRHFPGALFDLHGYILFSDESTLRSTSGIHIGKQISIPAGISSLAGYMRVVDAESEPAFQTDELPASENYWEGSVRRISVNAYERDSKARRACISFFGPKCQVCSFDFEAAYGDIGRGFIHVHHTRPLSEIRSGYSVDPKRDLIPVCPNCHAMFHQPGPRLSVVDLKQRLQQTAASVGLPKP